MDTFSLVAASAAAGDCGRGGGLFWGDGGIRGWGPAYCGGGQGGSGERGVPQAETGGVWGQVRCFIHRNEQGVSHSVSLTHMHTHTVSHMQPDSVTHTMSHTHTHTPAAFTQLESATHNVLHTLTASHTVPLTWAVSYTCRRCCAYSVTQTC